MKVRFWTVKIRKDIVTNSSSSSYIISKNNIYKSQEDIYQYIKQITKEYIQKLTDALNELEVLYILTKDYKLIDKSTNKQVEPIKLAAILSDIKNKYELNIYDLIDFKYYISTKDILYKIINNKTYADYCDHNGNHDSFIIIDLTNDNNIDDYSYDEIINWYIGCYNDVKRYNCEYCNAINKEYCYIPDNNYTSDTPFYSIFGEYAVYEEDGIELRLPDYIRNRLSNISNFCCGHMG